MVGRNQNFLEYFKKYEGDDGDSIVVGWFAVNARICCFGSLAIFIGSELFYELCIKTALETLRPA
jgi:hypothetical protein